MVASRIIELAAIACRTVLRVKLCKGGELRLAAVHAAGKLAQLPFDALHLLARDARLGGDDLHLHLRGNEGQTVFGHLLEIFAHLGGRHGHAAHKFALHLEHHFLFALHLLILLAELRNLLAGKDFHGFARTVLLNKVVDALVYGAYHVALAHLDAVQFGLVQVKLLQGDLLGNGAVGIVHGVAAGQFGRDAHFFDVGEQNRFIAYHPNYLVYHVLLRSGKHGQHSGKDEQDSSNHTILYI